MGFKVASRVRGLSDEAFREAFGTEEQCRTALVRLRWPDGFVCPCCGHREHCVLAGRGLYQCNRCKKQTSPTAGTIFHATKLPLTLWFAAIHLIVTAKNGISSVELGRRLGVKQPTAWAVKHKIMAVMARREGETALTGRVEMDDAYLGGVRSGGKRGRGAAGKTPFVDRAPAEVVATLLDEGHYLCSERTMYRILAADQPVRERRNQREHPQYTKPELVATAPNQTWSWDITKLLGPTKWTYFYLYVVLDIFSRYAVGWMVADRENSALAGRLIEETCHKQGVQPQVLTLHSDRGAPMTSKCTAQLLADLGVTRSLSRPQVSDDNPFSEAQFKTLKYHPGFPGRFHDITAAIAFCRTFFPWYNTEHRHGGIAMLTPDDVHHNRTQSVLEQRGRTLQAAWTRHPERFVRGIPQPDPFPKPSGSTHL